MTLSAFVCWASSSIIMSYLACLHAVNVLLLFFEIHNSNNSSKVGGKGGRL